MRFRRADSPTIWDSCSNLGVQEQWLLDAREVVRARQSARILAFGSDAITEFDLSLGPRFSWRRPGRAAGRAIAAGCEPADQSYLVWIDSGTSVECWRLTPGAPGPIKVPCQSWPALTVIAPMHAGGFVAIRPDRCLSLHRSAEECADREFSKAPLTPTSAYVDPASKRLWIAGRSPDSQETWGVVALDFNSGNYRSVSSLDGPAMSIWVDAGSGSETIVVVRAGKTVWPSSGLPHPGGADVNLPWQEGFEILKRQALEGQVEVHKHRTPVRLAPELGASTQLLGPEAGGLLAFDTGVIWKLTGLR